MVEHTLFRKEAQELNHVESARPNDLFMVSYGHRGCWGSFLVNVSYLQRIKDVSMMWYWIIGLGVLFILHLLAKYTISTLLPYYYGIFPGYVYKKTAFYVQTGDIHLIPRCWYIGCPQGFGVYWMFFVWTFERVDANNKG